MIANRCRILIAGAFALLCSIGALGVPGCRADTPGDADGDGDNRVVLYSSVDAEFLRMAVERLEATTGLTIDVVTDTEATKTFGLVQRVISERERPRADVWWSSEPFGTMRLAEAGVLAPWADPMEDEPSEWADAPRGATWRGFAARGRVLVYPASVSDGAALPMTVEDLATARHAGRVAIARPQFGTTRGHVAALCAHWGPERFEAWLRALHDNGVRQYDSNSTVVREVAMGAVAFALTDTDDVYASQAAGRDVALLHLPTDPGAGPLVLPNTVAVVAGSPNPGGAERLARAIRSAEIERLLAESASRNTPLHAGLREEFPELAIPNPMRIDLERVYAAEDEALAIVDRVFGG